MKLPFCLNKIYNLNQLEILEIIDFVDSGVLIQIKMQMQCHIDVLGRIQMQRF